MKRVAILISGGGSNMLALLRSMLHDADHPARPCLVVSNRPDAAGLARARALGVAAASIDHQAFTSREAFEAQLCAALDEYHPDILCLAGFMRILTPGFVAGWTGRCLNIHPSLLPKYPGLHTHARVLADGEAWHGCSVHEVTQELDQGPILGQARLPVLPNDTTDRLAARVLKLEHALYPAVLRRYAAGDRRPVEMRQEGGELSTLA
ncbi:MAG: phosphoribosylglycinamide formyltransferase [Pseudomonadota bacterium]